MRPKLWQCWWLNKNIPKDNVRYFSHICGKAGLVGKTEGLRKAQRRGDGAHQSGRATAGSV